MRKNPIIYKLILFTSIILGAFNTAYAQQQNHAVHQHDVHSEHATHQDKKQNSEQKKNNKEKTDYENPKK